MNVTRERPFGFRTIVGLAALFIVIEGFKVAQTFLVPFLLALFLAILGATPVAWLKRKRVPAGIAIGLVTLLLVGLFTIFGIFLGNSVNDFLSKLPHYQDRLNQLFFTLNTWLADHGYESASVVLSNSLQPSAILNVFTTSLRNLVGTLSMTFLVVILVIFILMEANLFKLKIAVAFPGSTSIKDLEATTDDVKKYLLIKTATSSLTGILIWAWVSIMQVDFPILWGVLAFLLNYIPFIGSTIAAIPAIVLSLVQYGVTDSITLTIGYLVCNIGVSNFLEPILMGRRLGLSPLVVFLSLVFWGWIWGPIGALMSVPLTMILKILMERSNEFRWIAILMDSQPRTGNGDLQRGSISSDSI